MNNNLTVSTIPAPIGKKGGKVGLITMILALMTFGSAMAADVQLAYDSSDGYYYVNMPKTGTNTLTLDSNVQTFKVYDDGGKNENYSKYCGGYLVINAPEGYKLQLSGYIYTSKGTDYLTVYDGATNSDTKLIDKMSSSSQGAYKNIGTVTSSSQSMMLYFSSFYTVYEGLFLTVTLVDPGAKYGINVNNATGGTVTANVSEAEAEKTVSLNVTAEEGYVLRDIYVKDANNNTIQISGFTGINTETVEFSMPGSEVTVHPTFTNTLTANNEIFINLPSTSQTSYTLPEGTVSFFVYDDGGKTNSYSSSCRGTLILTAPEGKVIQLSGSIVSETGCDKLTVYDGNSTSAPKLIDGASGNINIGTIVSAGQDLTFYFSSDESVNNNGLYLTAEVVDPTEAHSINIVSTQGGQVSSDKATAISNETVTLTITPDAGYALTGLTVTNENAVTLGYPITINVEGGTWYSGYSASFIMTGKDVTVTPTFTNSPTGLSVNMPTNSRKDHYEEVDGSTLVWFEYIPLEVNIPECVESFKVYDDGGPDGYAKANSNGVMVLNAPEGYVLQLTGTMTSEPYDRLHIYDGNSVNATQITQKSSRTYGESIDIGTITSSGRYMTLLFYTEILFYYANLNLTVTLVPTTSTNNVEIANVEHGNVVSNATTPNAGQVVTLTATPDEGYVLDAITAVDAYGKEIPVSGGAWFTGDNATIIMPNSDIIATPAYTTVEDRHINMPWQGTVNATIPSHVTSFKIYDDGGSASNYSTDCTGSIILTAPEGCVLRLTGTVTTGASTSSSLSVYDGNGSANTALLDQMHSSTEGEPIDIGNIVSTGQTMTLQFSNTLSYVSEGLELTVTVVQALDIALNNNADNTALLTENESSLCNVTLADRTLYKDGSWNTLCLPFDVNISGSVLDGDNVQVMTLNDAEFSGGTLTLNFTPATTIEAGKPYIIKWDETGDDLVNPVFSGVTVGSSETTPVEITGVISFTGTYAPVSIEAEGDRTKLFMGATNTLYYPNAAMTIGCQRAYFQLAEGITAGDINSSVNAIVMNFDGETTSIDHITWSTANGQWSMVNGQRSMVNGQWHSLDGRKLQGQPTRRGIYIKDGKKYHIH